MREYLLGRPARFTATIVSKIRRRITHRLAAAISQCGQGMPQQFALWIGIASHETPYACRNEKTLGTATCHPEDVESSARRRTPDEGSMYCMRYSKAEADAKTVQPARLTASCLQALPRIAPSRAIVGRSHARTASPEIP